MLEFICTYDAGKVCSPVVINEYVINRSTDSLNLGKELDYSTSFDASFDFSIQEMEVALEGEIGIPDEVLSLTDAELHKWLMEYSV